MRSISKLLICLKKLVKSFTRVTGNLTFKLRSMFKPDPVKFFHVDINNAL